MASLLKYCEFDVRLIERILAKHGFESHFSKAVRSLSRKRTVLDRHGVRWKQLQARLQDLI